MSKKLCKLISDGFLDDHTKKYTHMVNKPKYVCMKCGRVANDEDSVCRPKKLKLDDEKKKEKKSEGFAKINDDIASEKIASKIERKVLGKTSKKESDDTVDKKFEEKFDKKVKKRIVKVSKSSLRKSAIQNDEIPVQDLEAETNFEDHLKENMEENYEENYPNED